MQITTQKAITLDCTEVLDIIAEHLRKKELLPEGQKFRSYATLGTGTKPETDGSLALKGPTDFRIKLVWIPAE